MKESEINEEDLWSNEGFVETIDQLDLKTRMRTFHMKHDEELNYNCLKCKKKISAHNKDWHVGMCDDCFNEECSKNNEF